MPAYVIIDIEIHSTEPYEEYKRLAPSSISAYGGRYLIRGGEVQILEGEWKPKRCVVLEFPSVEQAKAWWNSREYAAAKALRQSCSETQMVVVDGMPGAVTR
jgi:uncharacterized protein (DUF1330 family)